MILLDTHMWFWWVQGHPDLTAAFQQTIRESEATGLLVSAISLVEISRAAQLGGMSLPIPTGEWLDVALSYPGVELVPITAEIATEAYRLPEPFHRDPADRLIVATARILKVPVLTADSKIMTYAHVLKA